METGQQPRVRSGVLSGASDLVRELGGDLPSILRDAGLNARSFNNPDTPILASAVVRFLEAAAQHCHCQAFGLHLAEHQQLSLFGPLSPLFQSATTIRELMNDFAMWFPLHTQGALVALENDGDGLVLTYELAAGVAENRRQVVELGFGIIVAQIRLHCRQWRPEAVWLRHAPPTDLRDHRERLCHNLNFNADRNAMLLDAGTLVKPTISGDSLKHGNIALGFEQARRTQAGALRTRAEIAVRALLPFATCDLDAIAAIMRMSRRTLQRRLAANETSFELILDRVRADLAMSYLRDSDLSVAQMAEILQFSETSALSRACRRWYGASPRELRQVPITA